MLFGSAEQSEKVAGLPASEALKLTDSANFIEPGRLIALFGKAAKTNGALNDVEEEGEDSEDNT